MIDAILVATDASAAANRAIDLGADLAAKYHASLNLLHVIRDMQLPEEIAHMAEVEKLATSRSEVLHYVAKKIIGDAKTRAQAKGAAKIQTEIAEGDPATSILKYAQDHAVDLIVMGTRGLGGVKGMLLGSVSRKVSNLSAVDCLTVRG